MTTAPNKAQTRSSLPTNRHAGPALKGYRYQFKKTLHEILKLGLDGSITIEGIEDLDILTKEPMTIQVKYHERQTWSLKGMRNPVLQMLRSFSQQPDIKFVLYIHHSGAKNPPPSLSLEDLKECLTESPRDEPIVKHYCSFSHEELEAFTKAFHIQSGVSLAELKQQILNQLAEALQCDTEEAELLHLGRAIDLIYTKAILPTEAERNLTRHELIQSLKIKEYLYPMWHRATIGEKKFIQALKRDLAKSEYGNPQKSRGLMIAITEQSHKDILNLAKVLSDDFDGAKKRRLVTAQPWTLILDGKVNLIIQLKRELIKEGIVFNDGYEHLFFSKEILFQPPVVNSEGKNSLLKKASYQLRIVSMENARTIKTAESYIRKLILFSPSQNKKYPTFCSDTTRIDGINLKEMTRLIKEITSS